MTTTMTTERDLPLFTNPMHPRARLGGELFERIAHDIGDGWEDLQARARDLQAGFAETETGPTSFDPAAVANLMIDDEEFDWRRAVADDVRYAEIDVEIRRRIRAFVTTAKGHLESRADAWMNRHEADVCGGFQAERQRVVTAIQKLIPKLGGAQTVDDLVRFPDAIAPHTAGVVLLREFDDIRANHLALIQVSGGDRSTWWRGLDWVGNYEDAWAGYYLAAGIQVQQPENGRIIVEYEPAEAPWETTDTVDRLRAFTDIDVWTPTRRQFDAAKLRVDQAAVVARSEFTEEVRMNDSRRNASSPAGMYDQSFTRTTR